MSHGPRGKSSAELREIGKHEAEEVDISLPFKKRVLKEIAGYNDEYGITSLADVVTEINSRGKDLEFQGELAVYSTQNEKRVKKAIDQLVKEGWVKRVKVPGSRVGYVARGLEITKGNVYPRMNFRTNRHTRKKYPVRRGTFHYGKSIIDLGPDDL